jgi:glutamyl-tRNA reductase
MVEAMTQSIIKKLLHQPTTNLRQTVNDTNDDHAPYVHALREMFDLEQVVNTKDTED